MTDLGPSFRRQHTVGLDVPYRPKPEKLDASACFPFHPPKAKMANDRMARLLRALSFKRDTKFPAAIGEIQCPLLGAVPTACRPWHEARQHFGCAAHKGHTRSLLKKQIGSVWRFFDPPASASNESVQPAEQDREHDDG
jgi:hypothetical protein